MQNRGERTAGSLRFFSDRRFQADRIMRLKTALALALLAGSALAGDPAPDAIQGNWIGTWEGQGGMGGKNVAQIYGLGSGEYQAIFTAYDSGEQDKGEFTFGIRGSSQTEDKVVFEQNIDLGFLGMFTFHAEVEKGKLTGKYSNGKEYEGTMELKKVVPVSETVGIKPLPGAIVLFDGRDLDHWTVLRGQPNEWRIIDGALVAPSGDAPLPERAGHLASRETFQHAQIHVEFRVPYLPEKRGKERGKGGIYLAGRYELQIVDSFGFPRIKDAQGYYADKDALGAILGQYAPAEQPAFPPGEWQAFDITYHEATLDEQGTVVKPAEVTVRLNGETVQDRVELKKPTQHAPIQDRHGDAGLIIEHTGQPVEYRNIWFVPLNAGSN